jgi:sec-independent protein translocase protein TatA
MAPTWFKLLLVVGLIVVLFGGKGRISGLMGDLAKGIKTFKKGLMDDEQKPAVGQEAVDRLAASLKDRETLRAR